MAYAYTPFPYNPPPGLTAPEPRHPVVIVGAGPIGLSMAVDLALRGVKSVVLDDNNVVSALPKLHKLGPRYVIVKKGEHGSILSSRRGLFVAPAFPLAKVEDPTGAGDSFVGALVGYLAKTGGSIDASIRRGILYGSVVASFCCEGFGLNRTTKTTRKEINQRLRALEKMIRI